MAFPTPGNPLIRTIGGNEHDIPWRDKARLVCDQRLPGCFMVEQAGIIRAFLQLTTYPELLVNKSITPVKKYPVRKLRHHAYNRKPGSFTARPTESGLNLAQYNNAFDMISMFNFGTPIISSQSHNLTVIPAHGETVLGRFRRTVRNSIQRRYFVRELAPLGCMNN